MSHVRLSLLSMLLSVDQVFRQKIPERPKPRRAKRDVATCTSMQ